MANPKRSTICFRGNALRQITNFDANPNGGGVAAQRGLAPDGKPIGFRDGQLPDWTLTFNVPEYGTDAEVDWHALWTGKVEFDMSREADSKSMVWDPCRVVDIKESTAEDGVTGYSVTVLALGQERF